jgi:hypothetical protein
MDASLPIMFPTGFKTLGEAREAERTASRRRVGRLTCGEFTELWLTDYARAAGATRRTYRYGAAAFGRSSDTCASPSSIG